MPKIDASTMLALAADIETAITTGKVIFAELTTFLHAKGADLSQLEANRARLIADINAMRDELGSGPGLSGS